MSATDTITPATSVAEPILPWRQRLVDGAFVSVNGAYGEVFTGTNAVIAASDAEIADLRAALGRAVAPSDAIEARTERIRLSHANSDSKGKIQLRHEVECLLAHIALLRATQAATVTATAVASDDAQLLSVLKEARSWFSASGPLAVRLDAAIKAHGGSRCGMSADKAFDKWHKIYRRLDRNDARITWEAGLSEGIRRAATTSIEAPTSEPVRGASIDTPEFLGRTIAAASEAMSEGQGNEWDSFIAHINAWHASEISRLVGADEGGTQMVTRLMTEINDLRASQSASVEDASRLLKAAKVYAFNYCQDEAESEEDCVCGPKQHAEAIELFAAIAAMTKEPDTGTGKHGGEVAS